MAINARRYCRVMMIDSAIAPSNNTVLPKIIEDKIDPKVTVATKSKAISLANVRLPEMRINKNATIKDSKAQRQH